MDLNRLLTHRRPRWGRLEALLDRAEQRGLGNLHPAEAEELYRLYRLTSSDLNLVQTRTGHPAVVDALEALVGRAYAVLNVPRRTRPFYGWWRILRHRFPATVRAHRGALLFAALTMLAGVVFGASATALKPGTEAVFLNSSVGRPHLEQSPSERVARLERRQAGAAPSAEGGQGTGRGNVTGGSMTRMAAFLSTHNIKVTLFAFGLGLTFGVGTIVVLFFNGAMLGSLGWLYFEDGVFTFFVAWVGPHGAIELPCIWFGAAAGLIMARCQWRKEGGTMWQRIRMQGPALIDLLVGAASLLVVAAVIEAGFSQITEPAIPYELKITVAAMLFAALIAYLFFMPIERDNHRAAESAEGLSDEAEASRANRALAR
jgi:uncharacterized membrane protein SpoIIM required for sporulation